MKRALGDAIHLARRAQGLTQPEVAKAADITQAALSRYENDQRTPEPDVLARLASALEVTPRLLENGGRLRGAMAVDAHMRRRQTAKPTIWRQLEAQLNMYRLHTRQLFEEVGLQVDQMLPRFDPVGTPAAEAARLLRMQWRMPVGPVRDLAGWMEAAGCILIEDDFDTARVDGLSQWVDDHPMVMLNRLSPTDRKRLTMSHELGHLCLHAVDVTEDVEAEADVFAAEFLMPAETIRPQLRNLTIGKLYDLKREWGVSMHALLERAHNLRVISPAKRISFDKKFSAMGWRTREPISDELPPETATLPRRIGETLIEKGLTPEEIAHLAGYSSADVAHPFRPAGPLLRTDG